MVDETMQEMRKHGDPSFPVARYDWDQLNEDGMLLESHWHKEWEFFAIYEGCALFSVNGKMHHVKAHDVIFIPGDSIHMAERVNNSYCRYRSIVFSISLLKAPENDIIQQKYISPMCSNTINYDTILTDAHNFSSETSSSTAYELFDKLFNQMHERKKYYELAVKAYLYELLSCVFMAKDLENKAENVFNTNRLIGSTTSVKQAITYMNQNYQHDITLTNLASTANMSTGHFGKLFKQMTSYAPIDYLRNLRLSKAADKLVKTNDRILDIAYNVGFNNVGHFIRSFEKKFGCSPRNYRKLNRME